MTQLPPQPAPRVDIDMQRFHADPYPILARMQRDAPLAYVPQLDAFVMTRRDDVWHWEKQIDVLSSDQPDGLMTQLMGRNMMRKDGAAHQAERRAIFASVSPRTVRDHWSDMFRAATQDVLDRIRPLNTVDLVADFAMPVSAKALKAVTGLHDMPWRTMDRVSQAMIDGCANYAGQPEITARCHAATAEIDRHIQQATKAPPPWSMLASMQTAGLPEADIQANIKLAISGGQNEPRDAIAGTAWAVMAHPDVRAALQAGQLNWQGVFAEYARWMAPIGMSPRRVARDAQILGYDVPRDARVFLMFGAANRDPRHFAQPDAFDPWQDASAAVSFGAGPHFCAGAWVSRALIADIALPMLFEQLPKLRCDGPPQFQGWAFRGPRALTVRWD
ncbi:MAG: cytochrome P450 [Paracoccaceae bacterium]